MKTTLLVNTDHFLSIKSENFLKSINYRAKNFGRLIDTDFAEAFQSRRNIAVDNIFDLI